MTFPVRQCVVCRQSFERHLLYRLAVVEGHGIRLIAETVPEWRGLLRRSVYLCHDSHCIGTKGLIHRLQRSLKQPVPPDIISSLIR